MTVQTRATLQAQAALVRDETVTLANTASRVGATLLDIIESGIQEATISPPQITANQDNYNPTGLATATVLRLTTDASRNVTGIAAAGGAAPLQRKTLINVGSQNLVLAHQSASSTAANRIISPTGADLTLAPNESAVLWYDATATRWYVVARSAAGGGGGSGDIDGVVAGTLLSGGGLTGTVALNLADLAGLSVIGRSANTTGAPAAITAASDGQVLRRSGTTLGFGAVDLASANAVTGDLPFTSIAQLAGLSVLGRDTNSTGDMAAVTAGSDGHVLRRAGTALAFALLVNANIDAAAAIAGTKISPNFGAQDVITTGAVSAGASPASAGNLRLPFTGTVQFRNIGGSGDIIALTVKDVSSDNAIVIGGDLTGAGRPARVSIDSTASFTVSNTGNSRFIVGNAVSQFATATVTFTTDVVSPIITQADDTTNSSTGDTLLIHAQNATGTTANGGKLDLRSGTGTNEAGGVDISTGSVFRFRADVAGLFTRLFAPAGGTVGLNVGANQLVTVDSGTVTVTQPNAASSATTLNIAPGALTAVTAANRSDIGLGSVNSLQYTTGSAIAKTSMVGVQARTYTATSATQTLTVAATVHIDAAPTAGTNVAITRSAGLWIEAGGLAVGTGFATTGEIRGGGAAASPFTIQVRNHADSANVRIVTWTSASTTLEIGSNDANIGSVFIGGGGGSVSLLTAGVVRFQTGSTGCVFHTAVGQYLSTVVSPILNQAADATASVTGDTFTIHAQDVSGNTATTAGGLSLRGGNATGAGGTHTGGDVLISGGAATGASGTRNGGSVTIAAGDGATADGYVQLADGDGNVRLKINSTGIGLNGATPVARPDYTSATSVSRSISTGATLAQVVDVVGTMVADFITRGDFS